jgi:hypothetical protein
MIVTTSWGSHLQATSCDDISGIKAIKGDRSDLFMIDECQEPNDDVITALVDIAATPMLTDTGGMLDLLGTPPEAEPCFFSLALDNEGWRRFHWTQFDHDFPRSRELKWARVKEICAKRGLTVDVEESTDEHGRIVLKVRDATHPIVQREYFGIRKKDPNKIAYEYVAGRNDYDPATVDFSKGKWQHSYGLDLGFQDRDAIVVLAWRRDDPDRRLYVRFQWQRNHNDVDMLAPVVKAVHKVYRPVDQVGDHGGHGAVKVLETLTSRLGVVYAKKPTDVMVSVGFVNDDLRTGRLMFPTRDVETEVVKAAAGPESAKMFEGTDGTLASEAGRVMKTVNARTKKVEINKRGYHSDLTEAMRYAHHVSRAYRSKDRTPKKLTLDEERDRREAERDRAEQSGEF